MTADLITVTPGPTVNVWRNGALVASVTLTGPAALEHVLKILREVRANGWE